MLPHYIILSILSIFSAIISQGNVVAAIPEATAFASGSERIGGNKATTSIEARTDAIVTITKNNALVVRHPRDFELEARIIQWYSLLNVISSYISIYKFGKETCKWIKDDTKIGSHFVKASSAQIHTIGACIWKKEPKQKLADIELGLVGGGHSGGQLVIRRKSI